MMVVHQSPITAWISSAGMLVGPKRKAGGGKVFASKSKYHLHYFVPTVYTEPNYFVYRCNRRDVESTRFKVEDLTDGDEYEFRVVAYNEAGPSRPSTTAGPIVIQDQSCKTSIAKRLRCHTCDWFLHITLISVATETIASCLKNCF